MKKIILLAAIFATSLTANAQIVINEGFEDPTNLVDYFTVNVSDIPSEGWTFGGLIAYDGPSNSCLSVDYTSTAGSTIDTWAITPLLGYKNGNIVSFYTRTAPGSTFPDRLELRIDPTGDGNNPTSVDQGSYTELLLSINPNLEVGGYPEVWTLQTINISGLPPGITYTRFAFRYWVTDGGPNGSNSNIIGIDRFIVDGAILEIEDLDFHEFNYYVADNFLNISANTLMKKVVLYNMMGQKVITQKLTSNNETINLSGLQSGIYIATVFIDGVSKRFKISKN